MKKTTKKTAFKKESKKKIIKEIKEPFPPNFTIRTITITEVKQGNCLTYNTSESKFTHLELHTILKRFIAQIEDMMKK